jgi:hypothetical protein
MMGRSDMVFSPPKTEPFSVLPNRMAIRSNGTIFSTPEPIAIVLPVPCMYRKIFMNNKDGEEHQPC